MRTVHSGVGVVTRRAHEVVRVVLPELICEPGVLQAAGGRGHKVDSWTPGWTPFSRKHWTVQENGRGGRDGQGTEERRVIFILSAAASRRMVLRVGEKSELLCILLWTQPPILGVHEKESVT